MTRRLPARVPQAPTARKSFSHRGRWIGVAAGIAAFTATAALAFTRNQGAHSVPLPLAPLSSLGHIRLLTAGGPAGPEGVPMPNAPVLAPARAPTSGERIDGIACQAREQVLFHIHAHLTIIVRGAARRVPAGIGIATPFEAVRTPVGPFVVAASCFMWLHTHAADGIIHTESPVERTYTLGELFDIWGQPLDPTRVGPARGHVTALFDGQVFTGNPRRIPLLAHAQIQLEVGRPLVDPATIVFPDGL